MKRLLAYSLLLVVLFGCGANQKELNNMRKERDELSARVNAEPRSSRLYVIRSQCSLSLLTSA